MAQLNISFILINFIILIFAVNAKLHSLVDGGPFSYLSAKIKKNNNKIIPMQTSPGLVFPGTKWCGPGDIAEDENDLGKYRETDICCRAHDLCDDLLLPGEENHGLKNDDWFTRLNCKCDKAFFNCLHASNHTVSNIIGTQYFFFRSICFKEAHPIKDCVDYQETYFSKRCIKYSFDESESKEYQWFDLPYYDAEYFSNITDEVEKFYNLYKDYKKGINLF